MPSVVRTSLSASGYAGERAELRRPRTLRRRRRGRGERTVGVDVQEGVHVAVDGGDAVEVGLGDLDRGGSPVAISGGQVGSGTAG